MRERLLEESDVITQSNLLLARDGKSASIWCVLVLAIVHKSAEWLPLYASDSRSRKV